MRPIDLSPTGSTPPRTEHTATGACAPRWTRWATPAALAWSVATVAWAATWALGLLPHPFADPDQVAMGAVLNAYDPMVGIGTALVIGGLGTVTALAGLRRPAGSSARLGPVVVAWALAGILALVMVTGRLLSLLGYALVVPVLGWFEPGLFGDFLRAAAELDTLFVVGSTVGALLWGAVGLTRHRVRRQACLACGRPHGWGRADDTATRGQARRVGRIAVGIAVVMALGYPAVRLPWLFGSPAGLDAQTWAELQATGGDRAGIGLGLAAVAGALLMTGLISRWGERFPRWMVGLAGRRVPISLAVGPAAIVALALVATGRGVLPAIVAGASRIPGGWLQTAPFLALIPWGIALAVATAAYVVRRRGSCPTCAWDTAAGGAHAPDVQPA